MTSGCSLIALDRLAFSLVINRLLFTRRPEKCHAGSERGRTVRERMILKAL
jgi:hypothetical protein